MVAPKRRRGGTAAAGDDLGHPPVSPPPDEAPSSLTAPQEEEPLQEHQFVDVAGPSGNTTPPDHFTPPPSSPAVRVESPSNSERIGAMHALEALPPLEDVGGPLPDELVPDEDITIAHAFTRVFHVAKDSKSVSKTPGLDERRRRCLTLATRYLGRLYDSSAPGLSRSTIHKFQPASRNLRYRLPCSPRATDIAPFDSGGPRH